MFTADIATISARGQVAIPADIRKQLDLKQGDKLLFMARGEEIVMRKSDSLEKFFQATEPFLKKKKKIQEEDVVKLIHESRKRRRRH